MNDAIAKGGVVSILLFLFFLGVFLSGELYSQKRYSEVGEPKIRDKDPCDNFEIFAYFDPPRKISLAEYMMSAGLVNMRPAPHWVTGLLSGRHLTRKSCSTIIVL